MCEPEQYSEVYKGIKEAMETFTNINVLCTQALYANRFHPQKIKKLYKYLDNVKTTKEEVELELENISKSFDNIDTKLIIYLHNIKRVQDELENLAELQEKEINEIKLGTLDLSNVNSDEIYTFKRSDIESDNEDEVAETVKSYLSNCECSSCEDNKFECEKK